MIKTIKSSRIFLGGAAAIGFMVPFAIAFAQGLSLPNPLGGGGGCSDFISCIVTPVTNFLLVLATPICAIMVLWGGFEMMTSAGDPEKFSNARKTIIYAAVGFVVVLLANSVATIIQNTLTGH